MLRKQHKCVWFILSKCFYLTCTFSTPFANNLSLFQNFSEGIGNELTKSILPSILHSMFYSFSFLNVSWQCISTRKCYTLNLCHPFQNKPLYAFLPFPLSSPTLLTTVPLLSTVGTRYKFFFRGGFKVNFLVEKYLMLRLHLFPG